MVGISTTLLLISVFLRSGCSYTIPLSGYWSLTDGNLTTNFNLTLTGTDVFSVLWGNGLIGDPLSGNGDTNLRYISYRNWTFSHYFKIAYFDTLRNTFLVLGDVDTFCCVYLNKQLITCTENSFIQINLPINSIMHHGLNSLQLAFKSTPLMAKKAYERLSPNPPPPACWPSIFKGECYINAVRTTQAAFGWDWGPAFPIQGFWKLPRLRFDRVWLGDGLLFFPAMTGPSSWKAAISVEVLQGSSSSNVGQNVCIRVKLGGGLTNGWIQRCISLLHSETQVWIELPLISNITVRPWWPLGVHDGPYLYILRVELRYPNARFLLDSKSFWIGFRQVELVQVRNDLYSNQGLPKCYFHIEAG